MALWATDIRSAIMSVYVPSLSLSPSVCAHYKCAVHGRLRWDTLISQLISFGPIWFRSEPTVCTRRTHFTNEGNQHLDTTIVACVCMCPMVHWLLTPLCVCVCSTQYTHSHMSEPIGSLFAELNWWHMKQKCPILWRHGVMWTLQIRF